MPQRPSLSRRWRRFPSQHPRMTNPLRPKRQSSPKHRRFRQALRKRSPRRRQKRPQKPPKNHRQKARKLRRKHRPTKRRKWLRRQRLKFQKRIRHPNRCRPPCSPRLPPLTPHRRPPRHRPCHCQGLNSCHLRPQRWHAAPILLLHCWRAPPYNRGKHPPKHALWAHLSRPFRLPQPPAQQRFLRPLHRRPVPLRLQ